MVTRRGRLAAHLNGRNLPVNWAIASFSTRLINHIASGDFTMTLRTWPKAERPREKMQAFGVASLSDAELLAVILTSGHQRQSALDLGHALLRQFGNPLAIVTAKSSELEQIPGMGVAKICKFHAIHELGLRLKIREIKGKEALTNTSSAREFLQRKFYRYEIEVFCGIFLNTQNQVLAFEELFKGTIDGAAVYPREVIKRCLQHNAAAIILAHNHPSGVAEPSQADIAITAKLKRALAAIDVRVLDHLVVGQNEVTSMTERALL